MSTNNLNRLDLTREYYNKITQSNRESPKKEALKDFLNRIYINDTEALKLIDLMSIGAEHLLVNIPLKDKLKAGFADTQYHNIIIEFKNDLKKSLNTAISQLKEYLVGNYIKNNNYNFSLIASDGLNWYVYSPDPTHLMKDGHIAANNVILKEVDSFILKPTTFNEFYFFIDRYLFRIDEYKPTLGNILFDFGDTSLTYINSITHLHSVFTHLEDNPEIQVIYEQWYRFLSIAYGEFEGSIGQFLTHTYLSLFSKLLAYEIITNDDFIDEDELKGILNGTIFDKLNIYNFVENDFFFWLGKEEVFDSLKPVFRTITQTLGRYNFIDVKEDILKGVYQNLIDIDTRAALGEYYTPDWLCERIVKEYDIGRTSTVLDPACGSGSFLRATISFMKNKYQDITIEELSQNIVGIDIHPLSVQISKTTLLLAYGDKVSLLKTPIFLRVFLANTLLAPEGSINLFHNEFNLLIDKKPYLISTQIFDNINLFDTALNVCEILAEDSKKGKNINLKVLKNSINREYGASDISDEIMEGFYQIYKGIKIAKENNRNGIWKFILQNLSLLSD